MISAGDGARKCSDTLVIFKAACFMQGDENGYSEEKPVHQVCLSEYLIENHEVTRSQYAAFEATPAGQAHKARRYGEGFDEANRPVSGVTWKGAQAYCEWRYPANRAMKLGQGRLPTEAEWERAAREDKGYGDNPCKYPTTTCRADPTDDKVQFRARTPADVCSKDGDKTSDGMYDMTANVAEWVFDTYKADAYSMLPAQDPVNKGTGDRVVRGGCWLNYGVGGLRAAYRVNGGFDPGGRDNGVGFRCAVPRTP